MTGSERGGGAEDRAGEAGGRERSPLDEAELDEEFAGEELEAFDEQESAEAEEDGRLEVAHLLAGPPPDDTPDTLEPEEREERLETESEAAEVLSLHEETPLFAGLLDEEELGEEAAEEFADEIEDEGEGEESPAAMVLTVARHRLAAERARLERLAADFRSSGIGDRSEREDLGELSGVDQHPADQGTETFDRERDLSIREQVEGELAEVERALRKLEAGTYGRCEVCGRPIPAERLEAEPAARWCREDQRAVEQELFGEARRLSS